MPKINDLTGQKFGLLTVIGRAPNLGSGNRNSRWLCECSCPKRTQIIAFSAHLRSDHTTSCGCRRYESHNLKHGESMKPTRTYRAWLNARTRCNNPKIPQFKDWGGRGIEFRFDSYEQFREHLGECPPGHELDRIDINRHYELGNVHWIPKHSGLRRNSFLVELKGRTLKLGDAAKELGLDYFALHRLMHRRGFSFKQAVDYIKNNLNRNM